MRAIELKTTKLETGEAFAYKDVLMSKLRRHPNGITIEQMEKIALPTIAKLTIASGTLYVEEQEYEYLTARLAQPDWGIADTAIVELMHDVKDAPKVDPTELIAKK